MDRVIVYPGQLPQDTDVLYSNLFAMLGQSAQGQAILGTSTVVAGLACTPTSPASLQVNVDVGSIYQMDPVDSTVYGSIAINNSNVLKQGISNVAKTLTITPPGTTGFSQVYLVQVALQNIDNGATVLSYFNSANPDQPFSGPANSGSSQMTVRSCQCAIALKAGIAATTGTQVTPSPDAGYVGLYAITVANGASQITSGNIALLKTAPFFPTLPQVPYEVQQGKYVYAGQDTGSANAYVITFAAGQPQPAAYVAGMEVKFKAQNANTGASTINVNGLGAVAVRRGNGVALAANDIVSGGLVTLTYDGTLFQMSNYLGAGTTSNTTTTVSIPYVADSGTANAVIATYSPAITSGQQVAGLAIAVKLANALSGACTINVNGLGTKAIKTGDLANPPPGVYVAGEVLLLIYDGTQYQIANTSSLTYRKPIANTTIYVNGATGSDTLYDGTSPTVGSGTTGPLATIQKAVNVAFGYAPSQFTITINIAAGTYNEAVATPSYAGPNLIIDGNTAANVTINAVGGTCFALRGPNTATVTRLTIQSSGSASVAHGFSADSGANLTTTNTVSNAIAGTVFLANNGGVVAPSAHTFSGSCQFLFWGVVNGIVKIGGTFTFSTPISVSASCAASQGGQVDMGFSAGGVTFVNGGFVSGQKYSVSMVGVVQATSIGGAANIPGSGTSVSSGGIAI